MRAGTLVRESIKGGVGLLAGRGFAGGDTDFEAAGLQEPVGIYVSEGGFERGENIYEDATYRPSPREPPITTTILSSREKRLLKSLISVYAFASAANFASVN